MISFRLLVTPGVIFMALTLAVYGVFAGFARSSIPESATIMRWLSQSFTALAGRLAQERA
ncbi:MAG: hypothetical protein HKM96_06470 [Boseongicola sp.]|nr:hypothetical protein [Silicimonas sp.]NNF91008.1 hypothetical protein [Boseongicola sp.]RZW12669.1 MAG: hypothetical protein EX266_00535 [Paracoccaceae bacterium]